jgi:hypothetical protein
MKNVFVESKSIEIDKDDLKRSVQQCIDRIAVINSKVDDELINSISSMIINCFTNNYDIITLHGWIHTLNCISGILVDTFTDLITNQSNDIRNKINEIKNKNIQYSNILYNEELELLESKKSVINTLVSRVKTAIWLRCQNFLRAAYIIHVTQFVQSSDIYAKFDEEKKKLFLNSYTKIKYDNNSMIVYINLLSNVVESQPSLFDRNINNAILDLHIKSSITNIDNKIVDRTKRNKIKLNSKIIQLIELNDINQVIKYLLSTLNFLFKIIVHRLTLKYLVCLTSKSRLSLKKY